MEPFIFAIIPVAGAILIVILKVLRDRSKEEKNRRFQKNLENMSQTREDDITTYSASELGDESEKSFKKTEINQSSIENKKKPDLNQQIYNASKKRLANYPSAFKRNNSDEEETQLSIGPNTRPRNGATGKEDTPSKKIKHNKNRDKER